MTDLGSRRTWYFDCDQWLEAAGGRRAEVLLPALQQMPQRSKVRYQVSAAAPCTCLPCAPRQPPRLSGYTGSVLQYCTSMLACLQQAQPLPGSSHQMLSW